MTGDPIPAPTFLSLWAEFGDGTLARWAIRSPLHQLHYVTNPVGSALGNLAEAACLTSLIAVLHGIMRGVEQTHILVTSGGGEMFARLSDRARVLADICEFDAPLPVPWRVHLGAHPDAVTVDFPPWPQCFHLDVHTDVRCSTAEDAVWSIYNHGAMLWDDLGSAAVDARLP